ncbi:hypothetical protein jhhlp_004326 [Lomentospora prolificans]|uniref:GYF domain-containing protein n=1 Tax=Lomentospora prolificans TaxID=41688 RepID=A0A2N3NB75_9PEZI|nr:hypothetical protein jhhlp_004326 [Lomentospora prolificans]
MDHKRATVRPRRAGEAFARTHHLDNDDSEGGAATSATKKVKFDVRNPSALAASERDEEDAFLDADVIGKSSSSTTKRGAVNIDGFDSDSDDVDEFDARAQQRRKGNVDINEAFAKYDPNDDGTTKTSKAAKEDGEEDEDDVNMFAGSDDEDEPKKKKGGDEDDPEFYASGKKKKGVRFLDSEQIQGQDLRSTSGGVVRIDGEDSDDDEEEEDEAVDEDEEAWKEDVIDEEVGAGGRKKRAPKIEAFNLKEELEEGRFDENQNYVRNAVDPDAVHDRWLDGVSKKQMKQAAVAHQRREAEAQKQRMEEDSILTSDLLATLIKNLERGETALEALARLGRQQKRAHKVPKWKLKKQGSMDTDEQDPEQERISAAISTITDAADKLFSRDHADIYDEERELLVRQYKRETGQDWVEPRLEEVSSQDGPAATKMWEYRWVDGRGDGSHQGPYDGPTMKAWHDAGYFGEGVEFRPAGEGGGWSRIASFV